ncbi:cystatin domain-containing protein [Streptomyces sp. NPDC059680]|uniref:cystatin domain-containing protein n=1 Tax=Streptomyces sp. NPDC059680 TaxID=3346904 RepID=UPI00367707FF
MTGHHKKVRQTSAVLAGRYAAIALSLGAVAGVGTASAAPAMADALPSPASAGALTPEKLVAAGWTSQGVRESVAGGWTSQDVADRHIREIARWAVGEANREHHLTGSAAYHAVSVESAQTQVVAGENYRLQVRVDRPSAQVVDVVVSERPWDNFRSLTSFTPEKLVAAGWTSQGVRESVAGGWTSQDVADRHIREIARWAVGEANREHHLTGSAAYHAVSVESAQTQVVAGENYRLQVRVDRPSAQVVDVVVSERPWDNFRSLTSFTPENSV